MNETLAAGEDISSGALIAKKFANRTFMLPGGQRHVIDSNRERKGNILADLFNYSSGNFEVSGQTLYINNNKSIGKIRKHLEERCLFARK